MSSTPGLLRVPAGTSASSFLGALSPTSTDLAATLGVDRLTLGGNTYLSAIARRVPSAGAYQAKAVIGPAGQVAQSLVRAAATGVETTIRSAVKTPP